MSRFEFLEAVGVPPMQAAKERGRTPGGVSTPARRGSKSGGEFAKDKANSTRHSRTNREGGDRAKGERNGDSEDASDGDSGGEADCPKGSAEEQAAGEADMEAWCRALRRWDVTNLRARCQSQVGASRA